MNIIVRVVIGIVVGIVETGNGEPELCICLASTRSVVRTVLLQRNVGESLVGLDLHIVYVLLVL